MHFPFNHVTQHVRITAFRQSIILLSYPRMLVVNARDAWIQADAIRYAGANFCILWKAFASRGLGVGAASFTDSSAVPVVC